MDIATVVGLIASLVFLIGAALIEGKFEVMVAGHHGFAEDSPDVFISTATSGRFGREISAASDGGAQ